ncbi:MAG: hypothetical protein IJE43_02790 [Alphaproteobacteria bacterium]|nr:hypothetical protein [Alphaproteobacteria bacterium]MBQ6886308.1 hypothetical protein [Lachnospiraceae bacterium]
MTDYERWRQQMLNEVAAEEKHENIYKQCAVNEAIARITNKDVGETEIRNAYIRTQADAERSLYK